MSERRSPLMADPAALVAATGAMNVRGTGAVAAVAPRMVHQ